MGLEDALAEGISLAEWPDRFGPFLPDERLDILFSLSAEDEGRTAALTGYGRWAAQIEGIVQDMESA